MTDELSQENESGNELEAIVEAFENVVYYVHKSVSENNLILTITYSGVLGKLQAARDFVASCATRAREGIRRLWLHEDDDELRAVSTFKDECELAQHELYCLIDNLQNSTVKLGMVIEQCETLEKRLKKQETESEE